MGAREPSRNRLLVPARQRTRFLAPTGCSKIPALDKTKRLLLFPLFFLILYVEQVHVCLYSLAGGEGGEGGTEGGLQREVVYLG
jgi:hypothetical protein